MSDDLEKPAPKEKSPAPEIDKAIKALLKEAMVEGDNALPAETVRARAAVISVAINWQKVKHHIKEGEEFDPSLI
jgi:flagellar biosynthesis regulator FlaF